MAPTTRFLRLLVAALVVLCLGAGTGQGVVGGEPANPEAWPFTVALLRSDVADPGEAQFCAGTMVRPRWVLTAAHCVESSGRFVRPRDVEVAGGSRLSAIAPHRRIAVTRVVPYPVRTPSGGVGRGDDLALLRLARSPGLPSLALPSPSTPDEGRARRAWVAGWGVFDPVNGFLADELLTGRVSVFAPSVCQAAFGTSITDLCGTFPDSLEVAACSGDSGGPLVDFERGILIGVVSFGPALCGRGTTGFYADVARYRSWLVHVVRGGDPTVSQPEIVGVSARDDGPRLTFDAEWCQLRARGHQIVVEWTILSPRRDRVVRVARVRGRADDRVCLRAVTSLPDTVPIGSYPVVLKVIDRTTGLTSVLPLRGRLRVRSPGPDAAFARQRIRSEALTVRRVVAWTRGD